MVLGLKGEKTACVKRRLASFTVMPPTGPSVKNVGKQCTNTISDGHLVFAHVFRWARRGVCCS
jgi:hypothetical protein